MSEIRHSPLRMANARKVITEISKRLTDRPTDRPSAVFLLLFCSSKIYISSPLYLSSYKLNRIWFKSLQSHDPRHDNLLQL